MKQLRIYVDTSVIGGCFDEEFAEDSKTLLQRVFARRYPIAQGGGLSEVREDI